MQFSLHSRRGHRYFRSAVLGFLLLASVGLMRAKTALQPGEELTYSVRWAILPHAGKIRIAAAEHATYGSPQLSITTITETRGLANLLMGFQGRSESIFDLHSGRLVTLHESSVARNKRAEFAMDFDYANRRAFFTGKDADPERVLALPEGDPADLITTLMKTRLWDLQVGESRDVLVSFRDDFYELTVHGIELEQVKTSFGEFETIVLEPRMEKTPPKGMFKRGGQVRIWVSRDEVRLPVRFEVTLKIGTGVATLVNYTPPDAEDDSPFEADE